MADSYSGRGGVSGNVLRNDSGASAVVRHTEPADGTVVVNADGTFAYTPKYGFKGVDRFSYTATDAVELFEGAKVPPLGVVAGPGGTKTEVSGAGFGSSFTPVPGKAGYFYGLTDRGPNADAPDGDKSEMFLGSTPQIGKFKLVAARLSWSSGLR